MKALKKISSIILTLVLVVSLMPNAYALTVTEEISRGEPAQTSNDTVEVTASSGGESVDLYTSNPRLSSDTEGTCVSVDLLELNEETDANGNSRLVSWQIVGVAQFRLRPMEENNVAVADWSVTLIASERITAVNGFFYLYRDDFGPFNHEYDSRFVDFRADQLYNTASSSTLLSMNNMTTNKNIIFQWSGWEVSTVKKTYYISNGEVQGAISDFVPGV